MIKIEKIKNVFEKKYNEFNKKEFFSSVFFLSVIYAVAIISIIRANFSYNDDMRRSIEGIDMCGAFSRHVSDHLSFLLHTANRLTDISPLPQLIACVFLAITGYILVKIICGKSSKLALIATLPIGLSPYFLECFSYKFDAPYMAFSILVSVFPFLFVNKRWGFLTASIVSVLMMFMTYQAASGIFLMITIYLFFTNLNYKKITTKNNFIFLGISLFSYITAFFLFRLLFMESVDFPGYVQTDIPAFKDLISFIHKNLFSYVNNINSDFNLKHKILFFMIVIIFYIKSVIFSKTNKVLTVFLTLFFLILLFFASFGLYYALKDMWFGPRTMYGFGIFIAILSVDICYSLKKIFSFPAMALIWCFFVFSFAYGNALADQKRYNDFRTELLISDLSSSLPPEPNKEYAIKIINSIGLSPVAKNTGVNDPIIGKLVPINLQGGWSFGYYYICNYYNVNLNDYIFNSDIVDIETMPVVFDSFYHTIKYSDNQIVVILK